MAVALPAVGSWPDLDAELTLDPGLPHYDGHAQAIIEEQHYLIGRLGKRHVSAAWPGELGAGAEPTLTPGRVRATAAGPGAWDHVLSFTVHPRAAMVDEVVHVRVCSDNGGTVRIDCAEDASTSNSGAVAAGIQFARWTHAFAAARPDTLTTFNIYMQRDAGGTYIDMLGLDVYDKSLTAAALP